MRRRVRLSPMKIVAVLSEKGGAGKTTLTVHIATAAQLAGHSAAILDLDPQGSAYAWAEQRGSDPEALAIQPVALTGWLDKLRERGDGVAVLDTGRDSNNAGYTAAKAADLILIPFRAGGFDFMALGRTLDLCRLAGKRPYIVLNAMRPGAIRQADEAREALAGLDCDIAPTVLHDRADFRHASVSAKSAQELDPAGKAAAEIAELHLWIAQKLELPTIRQRRKATT
jgi:chromosome partitioning protein